jgi:hypothetical protein
MAIPTMQPVLRRGRSVLDRRLLPADENEGRLDHLLARAAELDLDGVLIFGSAHVPENLVYYGNYVPTTFVGVIVARPGHPPVLIAGKGGARDHPYIRTVSWIGDIRFYPELGAGIGEIVAQWGTGQPRLGTVGLDDALPHLMREGVVAAFGERLSPVDEPAVEQRRTKSARELAVLAEANRVAAEAAEAARRAFAEGAGGRACLAAADFAARAGDAHDCRITAGTAQGGVADLSEIDDGGDPLSALIHVEYLGYWGVAGLDTEGDGDLGGFDRILSRLRPGADARDVIDAEPQGADRYVVHGIGCAPAEAPDWSAAPRGVLAEGDVLNLVRLRQDGRLRMAARSVVITATGAKPLRQDAYRDGLT